MNTTTEPEKTEYKFEPLPVPRWNNPGEERLYRNTAVLQTSSVIEQLDPRIPGNFPRELIRPLIEERVYSDGRTSAHVKDTMPRYLPVDKLAALKEDPVEERVNRIHKANKDRRLDGIEVKLFRGFKEAGLPVPNIELVDGEDGFYIDDISGSFVPLNRYIARIIHYTLESSPQLDETAENNAAMQAIHNATVNLINAMPRFNDLVSRVLDDSDKEYIQESGYRKLSAKFGLDEEVVRADYHLFRLLEAVPGAAPEMEKIYKPLATLLDEAVERFGTWEADIHPGNVFVSPKTQEVQVTDFNRPRFSAMQMQLAYITDFYLPTLKQIGVFPIVPNIYESMGENPLQYQMQIVSQYILKWSELTGQEFDSQEFLKYLQPCRVYVNLRQARYALDELSEAKDYRTIFEKSLEVRHYLNMTYQALDAISYGAQIGIYEAGLAEDIKKNLLETIEHTFGQMIPKEVIQRTDAWARE